MARHPSASAFMPHGRARRRIASRAVCGFATLRIRDYDDQTRASQLAAARGRRTAAGRPSEPARSGAGGHEIAGFVTVRDGAWRVGRRRCGCALAALSRAGLGGRAVRRTRPDRLPERSLADRRRNSLVPRRDPLPIIIADLAVRAGAPRLRRSSASTSGPIRCPRDDP